MTVDWMSGEVTIPQGDLTFVSGTFYTGDTDALRILMKEEEASETGIVFPDITRHNTEVGPIVGVTYARTIEVINGYNLTFSPNSEWTVQLEGSNNNMWDVAGGILNQNQVQVIPTNSAGLQIVSTGSGLSGAQDTLLTQIGTLMDELHKIQGLDISNPMTVTPTTRVAGTVDLSISGDGETTTTVTRNP
jgi:hypothetical protein